MSTILILGNGISRLAFDEQIRAFPGEVWACNNAYIDYGDKLTRLSGHDWCMEGAAREREEKGYGYKIIGGLKWSGSLCEEEFTCKDVFRENTGTALVAEALTRGHDVIACGFDMGGPDVYSPEHEKRDKSVWVIRWRVILETFDPARVTFWGYDHKPYLLSDRPAREYAGRYLLGVPHIEGDEYGEAVRSWGGDYTRVWQSVPMASFRNIGSREWTLADIKGTFTGGMEVVIPEYLARKYAADYPGEFEVKPLRE